MRPKPGEPKTRREWMAFLAKNRLSPDDRYRETWPFSFPRLRVLVPRAGSRRYWQRMNQIRMITGPAPIPKKDWQVIPEKD